MYALEMKHIVKEFPGVRALDDVTFSVKKGEIHALCGENGAGKSTLMKVLSGVYPDGSFQGEIIVNGQKQSFKSIKDSEKAGISIIYQELALVKEMTVGENIFLGNEPKKFGTIDWDRLYIEADKWLKSVGLDIHAETKVGSLGIGQQQLVEIVKALSKNSDIIILDEPTAALTEAEVGLLMNILQELRKKGVTCIYISHKLNEVLALADSVTVLRDGKTVDTKPIAEFSEEKIISLMVGRTLTELFPYDPDKKIGETILEVKNFSVYNSQNKEVVRDVSFSLKKGEILGVAGLMGAGRTELFTSIFGGYEGKRTGEIRIEGYPVSIKNPRDAIERGLAYVSEDRKKYGLVLDMSVQKNTTLVALNKLIRNFVIDEAAEISITNQYIEKLKVKTPGAEARVNNLSGGNQQKVVLSKWLLNDPKVLILDEPTRGIDVGAKYEIYKLINELVRQGMAVVMISSELPEVLGMSDRILIMSEGKMVGELSHDEATQEKVMTYATGGGASEGSEAFL
ncbi:xylose ABC transporter ATP-binding protein [Brevibacillus brevis]|uniref:Xylose ABC transporter ATP-binding protein n=1 Tax=Brevibacillus brevis TaxID=1393 RepID=A0ABY9T6H4_BREBE|nr:xylose ABC transporter ATP-binding protein [Brevibacillus brevis]WNC14796.1 xylose ABC transporter ATP-binding protein [Brevibacillus brevis]